MARLDRVLSRASQTPWARKWGVCSKTPLREWPLITRNDLLSNPDQFLVANSPRIARRIVRTGGSSGTPVGFWLDRSAPIWERKHQFAQWARVGYRHGDWRLVLRGSVDAAEKVLSINHLRKEIHVSTFHLNDQRWEELTHVLPKRHRLWLHAYPSSALELVGLLARRSERNPLNFRGVLLGSENSSWEQRDFIAAHFGAPSFSWYGLSEKVALAGECQLSRQYHVNNAYGYIELLSSDGSPVSAPATTARIVATGLLNSCAPLVRYDTGDIAVLAENPCGCGLAGVRLANVIGREQDFVETGAGTRVSVAALNLHGAEYRGLIGLQYVQKSVGVVDVRVVAPDWSADRIELFEKALRIRLPESTVRVKIVDRLAVGRNGKCPLVVRD